MIREILQYPDPILLRPVEPVFLLDNKEALNNLIKDMFDTMYNAKGVGLSANQIGVPLAICVMNASYKEDKIGYKRVLINPRITEVSHKVEMKEGCLSLLDHYSIVERYENLVVEYVDLDGEHHLESFQGIWAQIIQHEVDHLNGKLYPENISEPKRSNIYKKFLASKNK